LNCRERDEEMIDHRSYTHNSSSCEIKARKNSGFNFATSQAVFITTMINVFKAGTVVIDIVPNPQDKIKNKTIKT